MQAFKKKWLTARVNVVVTVVLAGVVVLTVVLLVLAVVTVVKGTCSGSVTVAIGMVPLHSSSFSISTIFSSTVGMSLKGLSRPKNGFESINGLVFLFSLLSSHLVSVISSMEVVILSVVQVSLVNGLNGFCDELANLLLNGVVFWAICPQLSSEKCVTVTVSSAGGGLGVNGATPLTLRVNLSPPYELKYSKKAYNNKLARQTRLRIDSNNM